jgi:hypothetical protein
MTSLTVCGRKASILTMQRRSLPLIGNMPHNAPPGIALESLDQADIVALVDALLAPSVFMEKPVPVVGPA